MARFRKLEAPPAPDEKRRKEKPVQGRSPPDSRHGATLGFEQKLWQAADKMRGHMDPAEYKHVALGLIFIKYISDAFEAHREWVKGIPGADVEDRDEYAGEPFQEKMARLVAQLREQHVEARRLDEAIWKNLEELGYDR